MYDLAAPTNLPPFKKLLAGLVVAEPTAIVMYDSQRVLRQGRDGAFTSLDEAQWSDSLLKLVQAKLLEAYENAGLFTSVGRPVDGVAPETQLLVDIRRFGVSASPSAEIVMSAKLVSGDGKIIAEREFRRTQPIATNAAPDAVSALNNAFLDVETDIIAWTSDSL
jgi:phospholipid/cholesterol/gamma-HCH transport system substrate-binding protein